ncbi:hypothetical protein C8Q73DRAFT_463909 [Cubamyces lactineus]|nr:hypothetical protein C8Q73DRAFT_463909 [Cubamyces lactineus]
MAAGENITKIVDHVRFSGMSRHGERAYRIPRIPDGQTVTINDWQGHIRYGSSDHRRVVLLGLPNLDPTRISLPGAWNWGEEGRWRQRLPVNFLPAIAIAGISYMSTWGTCSSVFGLASSYNLVVCQVSAWAYCGKHSRASAYGNENGIQSLDHRSRRSKQISRTFEPSPAARTWAMSHNVCSYSGKTNGGVPSIKPARGWGASAKSR